MTELRTLARTHPADDAIREPLARGLSSMLMGAQTEGDPARRGALLADLQALAEAYPADDAVCALFANACSTRSAT